MKHCGPFIMDEASLSRAYQHVVDKKSPSFGIVTAYRSANSRKKNQQANKSLGNDLRSMGYGFFKMEGHWQECQDKDVDYKDCPKDKLVDSTEESYFVPGIKEEQIKHLCKKYDQDSVVFGDTKEDKTKLIFRNGSEDNIGKFHASKVAQAYSKFKAGKTFIFSKDAPKEPEQKKDIFGKDVKQDINKLKSLLPKDILNKTIKNPKTGNTIKVKSALGYDKQSPVFQAAKQLITKNN